jgi:hypothetical protein
VAQLRKWNARRKFRGGVKAVLAINKFTNLLGGLKSAGGGGGGGGGGAAEPEASSSGSIARAPWGTDEDVKPPPVPAVSRIHLKKN